MNTDRSESHSHRYIMWWLAVITLAALAVRVLRLEWQPLWWDEGYSVYFASEPLARMLWLTAHDIHPPFYYALLHYWSAIAGGLTPAVLRLLSVLVGVLAVPLTGWLGLLLYPQQARIALIAALLTAFNPMQIYYSQEVRMYGLALTLTLLSSGLLWQSVQRLERGESSVWQLTGYIIASTLALYTLYYTALLFAAHALWVIASTRRKAIVRWLLPAWLLIGIAYLPWLLYSLPKLVGYVAQKVQADQDRPLGVLVFLWRHLIAFTGGHIQSDAPALALFHYAGLLGLAITLFLAIRNTNWKNDKKTTSVPSATLQPMLALLSFLLIPLLFGFLLNLRLPFFPSGGERLLLFVLPYLLLICARLVAPFSPLALTGLAALSIASLAGIVTFYTTPRYSEHDYRPIVRQILQQGADSDSILAIFPWLVGYWRAYTPPDLPGPQPLLLSDGAVSYDQQIESQLADALESGRLWFPEPLSFGSSLPVEIERYLLASATNLENRWFNATTRLTAWAPRSAVAATPLGADFGKISLAAAAVGNQQVASANDTISARLDWTEHDANQALQVTLRLIDDAGSVWASRDYTPPGTFATTTTNPSEIVALNVPVGLAPGRYSLAAGVNEAGAPLTARLQGGVVSSLAPIGVVEVIQPDSAQRQERLPMSMVFRQPQMRDGIAWLGASAPVSPTLAGTALNTTIFFRSTSASPPLRHLYVSLLDEDGVGVAGWEGWPLPNYPTSAWPQGALVQAPIEFFLPPTLAAGRYQLIAGWLDSINGDKGAPVELGEIEIAQRPHSFATPTPTHVLDPAPLLGTHARLIGYDLEIVGDQLLLRLTWDVQQTLLPPHHIFVHVDDASGVTLAQDDGPPTIEDNQAPTGSWLPGEQMITTHRLPRPMGDHLVLRAGLYQPDSGVRLPVTIDGEVQGDAVLLGEIP
jgi:uncharacterized membrane protein